MRLCKDIRYSDYLLSSILVSFFWLNQVNGINLSTFPLYGKALREDTNKAGKKL